MKLNMKLNMSTTHVPHMQHDTVGPQNQSDDKQRCRPLHNLQRSWATCLYPPMPWRLSNGSHHVTFVYNYSHFVQYLSQHANTKEPLKFDYQPSLVYKLQLKCYPQILINTPRYIEYRLSITHNPQSATPHVSSDDICRIHNKNQVPNIKVDQSTSSNIAHVTYKHPSISWKS